MTDYRSRKRAAVAAGRRARVEALLTDPSDRDAARSDLYITAVQARGALRRLADGTPLPGPRVDVADAAQAAGDLTQAVLSLYLAASAARRYCEQHGESGPLGRPRLDEFLATITAMRDAVMHWDDKRQRDPQTFLTFSPREVLLYAPPRPKEEGPSRIDGLDWKEFREAALRLDRWASHHTGMPLGPELSP